MHVACLSLRVGILEPSCCRVCLQGGEGVEAKRVAAHAIADVQRQVVENVELLYEVFLAQSPSRAHRRERGPTVVLAEGRRAIATQGRLEAVFVGKRVVGTPIEGNHAKGRQVATLHGVDAVNLVGEREVIILQVVVVEVFHSEPEAVVLV